MSLAPKLAFQNLFQDKLRLIATAFGIGFSMALVTIQMGLYVSFQRMVTVMIDHADADLWIAPKGSNSFEDDPSFLDEQERFRGLSLAGVRQIVPLVVGFGRWRAPSGETSPIFLVGSGAQDEGLKPWNIVEGDFASLAIPGAVAIDRSYFDRLGASRIGESAEINDRKVDVRETTHGVRSFTTMPYVFVSPQFARAATGTPPNKASYFMVRLVAGASATAIRDQLRARLADSDVLTPDEFRDRSRTFWVSGTGAGAALLLGSLLALIVGTVIVSQTLYSSTKDHLPEFATLRAIGSSDGYIIEVIMIQAVISAIIGFALAAVMGWIVALATAETALPVMMTTATTSILLLLTIVMSVSSAILAIVKVMRVDPVMVFAS
ncbi:multidrug ABC transporter substrate-binding protein [Rhodoblastus sphagnicola]|uniref:Multidrug ABC transporter substrate-binding protein n=1 Tax=Rhodoblastus sphagnicola TaxID=333368 RepID=A0A2S6NET7_9HYPH|nr:ABC transporter permease [Rhodoblastus sphagnicola]MBB4200523.1 putative ABC transport system permease protein [Rhodoblastus sphagnicola]PPQ33165.1 multidrug ABC transporter substrate-binding protein [Rhodoblastus sphagnicola]